MTSAYIRNEVIPKARMYAQKVIRENPGLTETQLRELFTEYYNTYGDTLSRKELRTAYNQFSKVYAESLKAITTPQISKEAQKAIDALNRNVYKPYVPEANFSGMTHEQWLDELNNAVDMRKGNTDKEIIDALINDAKSTKDLAEAKELVASGSKEQKIAFVRKYKEFEKQEKVLQLAEETKKAEIDKALNEAKNAQKNLEKGKAAIKSAEDSMNVFMANPEETAKMEKLAYDRILSKAAAPVETIAEKPVEAVTEKIKNAAPGVVVEDAGKEAGEVAKEVAEDAGKKAGEVAKDAADDVAKAARKIGPWGWVGIGAAALIAIIASVSAHNKNKQQQFSAVA